MKWRAKARRKAPAMQVSAQQVALVGEQSTDVVEQGATQAHT